MTFRMATGFVLPQSSHKNNPQRSNSIIKMSLIANRISKAFSKNVPTEEQKSGKVVTIQKEGEEKVNIVEEKVNIVGEKVAEEIVKEGQNSEQFDMIPGSVCK